MAELIIFGLFLVAGIANAIQDTISHHWSRCIFNRIGKVAWWKWFRSDYQDRPDHPIWFIWDAWHFFKNLEKLCYLIAIGWITKNWIITLSSGIALAIGFNVFYKYILIKK